jgi:hypothetical protein
MSLSHSFPILLPDVQIGFYYKLRNIKDLYFHEALKNTLKELKISEVDNELNRLVSNESLQKLASFSLRGEALFALPIMLQTNPFLLGYYRLLLGFSQKEFYSKGPFGIFKMMEEKGIITVKARSGINDLASSLIASADYLVEKMNHIDLAQLYELQLLTVGPQLRGSKNNEYGQIATKKVFNLLKELVKKTITNSTSTIIEIKNDAGRFVRIEFSADPDIAISEKLKMGERPLISIEIKGGKDLSNIHNRIGEAEKSHQKAKNRGYLEFLTILSVETNYQKLKEESPTTNHFFRLDQILDFNTEEHHQFKDIITSALSIR